MKAYARPIYLAWFGKAIFPGQIQVVVACDSTDYREAVNAGYRTRVSRGVAQARGYTDLAGALTPYVETGELEDDIGEMGPDPVQVALYRDAVKAGIFPRF